MSLISEESIEAIALQLAQDWRAGTPHPAEHYLEQHPEAWANPLLAIRLIYEEVCQRQERGETVTPEELFRRFPPFAEELALLLDCHQMVQPAPPLFPEVGESLGDFHLVAELGRGARGRIYLARQRGLADRPVVVKVMPAQDREFLSLARLQHTHIIPLHGQFAFPERGLRALCEPYLGGASLERLLDLIGPVPPAQRTGSSLVQALERASVHPAPPGGQPLAALAATPYPEAIAWIGACLADALQHAHDRGLIHLDLKPSNVLLAADGQPLLLDFHLALHPLVAGQAAPDGLGGTPEYMSPEQREAFEAAQQGRSVPRAVDGRSDIYSLGRVLATALVGKGSALSGRKITRADNPEVSQGLADILGRCLQEDPERRYGRAADLADDLRRHLADQPLQGVGNRSLAELWAKWRRRRPHALGLMGLAGSLVLVLTILGLFVVERVTEAQQSLHDGQALVRRRAQSEAIRTLQRGRSRIEGIPGFAGLLAQFDDWEGRARRAEAAQRLHTVAEQLRLVACAESISPADLEVLDRQCRSVWDARKLVSPADEQARSDLLDVALLWIDLKGQIGTRDARSVLGEAEQLCGNSETLVRACKALEGEAILDLQPGRRSFREYQILGRALLRAGRLDRAMDELTWATDLRPQDFWAHFYSGVCRFRQQRYAEAITSFGVTIALAPDCPEAWYNRALALAALGNSESALRDCDRALKLAPGLAQAALQRGILHYQRANYPAAQADLERALRAGADAGKILFNLALVALARGDAATAVRYLEQTLELRPDHVEARLLREQLRARK